MQDKSQVDRLLQTAKGASRSLIVIQDIPDPDAIGSAEALRRLLAAKWRIKSVIANEGTAGRAENRGLLRYLGIDLAQMSNLVLNAFDLISTVDTQPQFANNSLPPDAPCHIVIDHHRTDGVPAGVGFADVRPTYGATSTILTEYLRLADVRLDVRLATALLYGIKSDTQDLGRESTDADTAAYLFLYPRADKASLSRIEHEGVTRAYFVSLHKALEQTRLYGPALICNTGAACRPEIIAEVADLLIRLSGIEYVLCYGLWKEQIIMSLRTDNPRGNAHTIVRRIIEGIGSGGGHEMFAGGQIPVVQGTPEETAGILEERFLAGLDLSGTTPAWLVPTGSTTPSASEPPTCERLEVHDEA
jgi:nanoRNase/pAp phosphatase (c-di-AMP/oligoRNAs hydrolase)